MITRPSVLVPCAGTRSSRLARFAVHLAALAAAVVLTLGGALIAAEAGTVLHPGPGEVDRGRDETGADVRLDQAGAVEVPSRDAPERCHPTTGVTPDGRSRPVGHRFETCLQTAPSETAPGRHAGGAWVSQAGAPVIAAPASASVGTWSVTLSASATSVPAGSNVTLTATANQLVTTTPYFIVILEGSEIIRACGDGMSCEVTVSRPTAATRQYTARLGSREGVVYSFFANSAWVPVMWTDESTWLVTLATNSTSVPGGSSVTLTATASRNVGPTQYYIRIFEGENVLVSCGGGTICQTTVSHNTAATGQYVARLERSDGSDVQASSGSVAVMWTDGSTWLVMLSATGTSGAVDSIVTLEATASRDVGGSPYRLQIRETGTITECGNTTSCTAVVSSDGTTRTRRFRAWLAGSVNDGPASKPVSVTWGTRWSVTLSATGTSVPAGSTVTLTATASEDVAQQPYYIYIFFDDFRVIETCGRGTTCTVAVSSPVAETRQYVAKIAQYNWLSVEATSDPVTVSWR